MAGGRWAVLACVLLSAASGAVRRGGAQVVATDGGVLAGQASGADGRALAGVRVHAEPEPEMDEEADAAGAGFSSLAGQDRREFSTVTDRRGRFVFLRLPMGRYRVFVEGHSAGETVPVVEVLVSTDPQYAVLRVAGVGSRVPAGTGWTVELADGLVSGMGLRALAQVEEGTSAESSPGDRADTPDEGELHGSDVPGPAPGAGLGIGLGVGREMATGGLGLRQGGATLDGLSVEQGFRSGARGGAGGGPVSGALFARGAVRNLRVGPGTYSAQAGGSGAGIAVGSRAGGKGVHGGGFLTLRESAFDAANPYAVATHYRDGVITSGVVKPADTDVQAGAHVGFALPGQSLRERVFGFVSLDGRVRNAPVESTPAVASFYALTATQRALLGTRGVTGTQINAALDYLDGLSGEIARSDTRLLSFGRVDVRPSERDAVAVTFAGNHFRSPAGAAFDRLADAVVASGRGSVGDSALDVEAVAGHWAHRFGRRLENAAAVQWVHDVESERPRAPLAQEPAISPGGEAPEVEIAPEGFTYGTAANLDRSAYPDEGRVEVADSVRWALGRHVLSLGGDWSRVADRVDSLRNANGTFLYDSGSTGGRAGGLVDWITDATFSVNAYPNGGCPSIVAAVHDFCFRTYTQSFGTGQQAFATHEFAGFAEDSFFARADLRVTLGARYEYVLLPLPQAPNSGLDASLRALLLPEPLAGATGAFPEDRNNAGPRVGVAWAPRAGRWLTAKAGYGWFFGRVPGTTVRAALADNGLATGIEQVRITPATEVACPQVANQGFGYPCAFTGTPPGAVAQTGTAMLFGERFRLPGVQRASLTVERAVGQRFAVELGYAGAWATQLPTSVDVNIAPAVSVVRYALQGGDGMPGLAAGRTFAVPLYTARRLAGVGPVTAITSQANATYHAGSLTGRMRGWHGVEARGSVVFSRAIDENPQTGSTPRVNGMFDPFAIGYDKGLSDTQAKLRFAGVVVARSDVKRGPVWVREGLGGWRLAASATAASGAPYSYEIFGGTRLTGGYESINGAGGATYLPTVGRNTLRLPVRGNVDLRLERGGSLRGVLHGAKLSGFAEAFNLLNQRSLSRVETRAFLPGTAVNGVTPLVFQDAAAVASEGVTTPPFGAATSSTSGAGRERLVAVGVRVEF